MNIFSLLIILIIRRTLRHAQRLWTRNIFIIPTKKILRVPKMTGNIFERVNSIVLFSESWECHLLYLLIFSKELIHLIIRHFTDSSEVMIVENLKIITFGSDYFPQIHILKLIYILNDVYKYKISVEYKFLTVFF